MGIYYSPFLCSLKQWPLATSDYFFSVAVATSEVPKKPQVTSDSQIELHRNIHYLIFHRKIIYITFMRSGTKALPKYPMIQVFFKHFFCMVKWI